jgi:D-serine deaminase-like pyridoxal phosphate-dependent protein
VRYTGSRTRGPRAIVGGVTLPVPVDVDTPYLFVDTDVLERNLQNMAAAAAVMDVALRPHAKTHKCPPLGLRQLQLGAAGLTVATVGEAEIFADGGCTDLFLGYPIWAAGNRGARLRRLAERVRLRVGVDSAEGAAVLAGALAGTDVEVLVEIDSGHHRSGVPAERAPEIALAAARGGLRVVGAFTFPGHGYGLGQRGRAAADEADALRRADDQLRRAGIETTVRSGGSTPTAMLSERGVLTEMRPGSYVFNDAQQFELGSCGWADLALYAVATVVSRSGRQVILDAGSKVLGTDRPAWATGFGRLPGHPAARVTALSEHHAIVAFPDGEPIPELGSPLRVVPNHVCTAVNLADELVVGTIDGAALDRWPVAARGANS